MIFQRLWAGLLGLGFLVVGVLRFIPIPSVLDLSVAQPVHGALHLVSGALLVAGAFWDGGSHAEVMNRWNGLFWVALGLLGVPGVVLYSDNSTHLFVGVASAALGWASLWSSVWRRRSMGFRRSVAWLLTGLLAVSFLGAGAMKLVGRPSMVAEFERIGVGQWFRYAVGGLELAGAAGLVVAATRRWAAASLGVVAAGASLTNIVVLHRSAIVPALLLVLAWVVVGTRLVADEGASS
jgi:putative oxidoreductase